jgi:hypothetical protein
MIFLNWSSENYFFSSLHQAKVGSLVYLTPILTLPVLSLHLWCIFIVILGLSRAFFYTFRIRISPELPVILLLPIDSKHFSFNCLTLKL